MAYPMSNAPGVPEPVKKKANQLNALVLSGRMSPEEAKEELNNFWNELEAPEREVPFLAPESHAAEIFTKRLLNEGTFGLADLITGGLQIPEARTGKEKFAQASGSIAGALASFLVPGGAIARIAKGGGTAARLLTNPLARQAVIQGLWGAGQAVGQRLGPLSRGELPAESLYGVVPETATQTALGLLPVPAFGIKNAVGRGLAAAGTGAAVDVGVQSALTGDVDPYQTLIQAAVQGAVHARPETFRYTPKKAKKPKAGEPEAKINIKNLLPPAEGDPVLGSAYQKVVGGEQEGVQYAFVGRDKSGKYVLSDVDQFGRIKSDIAPTEAKLIQVDALTPEGFDFQGKFLPKDAGISPSIVGKIHQSGAVVTSVDPVREVIQLRSPGDPLGVTEMKFADVKKATFSEGKVAPENIGNLTTVGTFSPVEYSGKARYRNKAGKVSKEVDVELQGGIPVGIKGSPHAKLSNYELLTVPRKVTSPADILSAQVAGYGIELPDGRKFAITKVGADAVDPVIEIVDKQINMIARPTLKQLIDLGARFTKEKLSPLPKAGGGTEGSGTSGARSGATESSVTEAEDALRSVIFDKESPLREGSLSDI